MGRCRVLPDDEAVPGELFTRLRDRCPAGRAGATRDLRSRDGRDAVRATTTWPACSGAPVTAGWRGEEEGGNDVRATVLRADGTVLHPARYTRIGDDALFDDDRDAADGRDADAVVRPPCRGRAELGVGEPVAALRDDGVPAAVRGRARDDDASIGRAVVVEAGVARRHADQRKNFSQSNRPGCGVRRRGSGALRGRKSGENCACGSIARARKLPTIGNALCAPAPSNRCAASRCHRRSRPTHRPPVADASG